HMQAREGDALRGLLGDDSWLVRRQATRALATLFAGQPDALDPATRTALAERSRADPEYAVRQAAVLALAGLSPSDPPPPAARPDPEEGARRELQERAQRVQQLLNVAYDPGVPEELRKAVVEFLGRQDPLSDEELTATRIDRLAAAEAAAARGAGPAAG